MFERDEVVTKFKDLVFFIAKKFRSRNVDLEDLAQEGYAALMASYDRYDPSFGTKFITFAYPWVYSAMQTYCESQAEPVAIAHRAACQAQIAARTTPDASASHLGVPLIETSLTVVQRDQTDQVIAAIDHRCVWEALESLPARDRDILLKHVVEEHTLQAIATDMGFSREYARQILVRALGKLRRKLATKASAI